MILTELHYVERTHRTDNGVTIYTDSKIKLDRLKKPKYTHIIEEIRRKIIETTRTSWEITLCWVKANVGILGNELADTLGKKAMTNESLKEDYNRIPKSAVSRETDEESAKKFQRNWTQITKGSITKEYFPNVENRLKMKINLTQNLAALLTGHGKTEA